MCLRLSFNYNDYGLRQLKLSLIGRLVFVSGDYGCSDDESNHEKILIVPEQKKSVSLPSIQLQKCDFPQR